jgi:NTP pyrophosphatase (non-canonical NTP hydrolase)
MNEAIIYGILTVVIVFAACVMWEMSKNVMFNGLKKELKKQDLNINLPKKFQLLNDLSIECHDRSRANGFWDKPSNIGEKLMLIVSELSEALEADRKSKYSTNINEIEWHNDWHLKDESKDKEIFLKLIKDTHEDEIADVFIRLFDYCGGMNIPIGDHIAAKIGYNSTRPYKHGKNY